MNRSEPCGYYHVCTDGNAIPWMFKDDEDFRHGLNRIGICKILTGVFVIAYTLMDNHLHFVLYGTMQECKDFINKYKLLLGKWIRQKYGEAEAIRGIPSQIIAIKTPEDLLETIAYIDRNCIMAGFKGIPADYPWGSAKHIFRNSNETDNTSTYKKISDYGTIEIREILKTRLQIPGDWTIDSNGMINPTCYLDWKKVEQIFISPVRYIYFLSKKLEGKIDMIVSQSNNTFIKDKDLRVIVEHLASDMFNCPDIRILKISSRLQIARKLRYEYACTTKQIGRMLHLDQETLKGFI